MHKPWWFPSLIALMLAACSSAPHKPATTDRTAPDRPATTAGRFSLQSPALANEIVIFSLGLIDIGYQFGGRNPEAGLDCSGMVAYVVEQVAGKRLPHNAAQIAGITRQIQRSELRPADLVFFNTSGKRYSHMGIYIGDGKFIHAPSSRGRVRVERMDSTYFSPRFDGARSLY